LILANMGSMGRLFLLVAIAVPKHDDRFFVGTLSGAVYSAVAAVVPHTNKIAILGMLASLSPRSHCCSDKAYLGRTPVDGVYDRPTNA
jgi:hypothetical protein